MPFTLLVVDLFPFSRLNIALLLSVFIPPSQLSVALGWPCEHVGCILHVRLVYLDGFDLTACPLVKRKALLKSILPKDNTGRVRFTDHISGSGERLFEKLEALKLEGMGMKRKASVYSFMRSRDWLKVRTSAGRMTMQKRIENWS